MIKTGLGTKLIQTKGYGSPLCLFPEITMKLIVENKLQVCTYMQIYIYKHIYMNFCHLNIIPLQLLHVCILFFEILSQCVTFISEDPLHAHPLLGILDEHAKD